MIPPLKKYPSNSTGVKAIRDLAPNFNKDYIVIFIPEGKKDYKLNSIVAIDTRSGIVYPLPFDSYGGYLNDDGSDIPNKPATVIFNINDNKIGAVLD